MRNLLLGYVVGEFSVMVSTEREGGRGIRALVERIRVAQGPTNISKQKGIILRMLNDDCETFH